ncbi:MAG: glycosyltransferase family 4 protein, partial [Syntrophomonadaceae bacterium]|nr:glycosyltransferase family 4 protein [Syntrophomonadaceae bacterium]
RQLIREKFELPHSDKVLLFTGSIIERKGIDLLTEAFLQIAPDHPDLYLWLIGPVSKSENASLNEDFVAKMKKQVSAAGLSDRVRFEGLVSDRGDLAEAYQAADVFVFPSRIEGLPNVVLEAMSSGLPVIVTDLPGLKGVVESGENGIVVPIGDTGALSAAISDILHNNVTAQRIGRNARSYIELVHGFDTWQKEMTSCYQKLMKSVTESTD